MEYRGGRLALGRRKGSLGTDAGVRRGKGVMGVFTYHIIFFTYYIMYIILRMTEIILYVGVRYNIMWE
jgi:hypothetical protein